MQDNYNENNPAAENGIIGALLDPETAGEAAAEIAALGILTDEHFAARETRALWRALLMHGNDMQEARKAAMKKGVAGKAIDEIAKSGAAVQNIRGYCEQLDSAYKARAFAAYKAAIKEAKDDSGLQQARRDYEAAVIAGGRRRIFSHSEMLEQANEREAAAAKTDTGIPELDTALGGGGCANGKIYTIAGHPGVCKTTLALQIAARADIAALFLLDDEPYECVKNVDAVLRTRGNRGAMHYVGECRDALQMQADCARIFANAGDAARKIILLDYVQKLRAGESAQNKADEIALVMSALRTIATQTGAAIVALSAVGKSESKTEKNSGGGNGKYLPGTPNLSAMRDGSSIEFESNAVLVLHTDDIEKNTRQLTMPKARRMPGLAPLMLRFADDGYTLETDDGAPNAAANTGFRNKTQNNTAGLNK